MKKFYFVGQEYSRGQKVVIDPLCNSVTVINSGSNTIYVNGIPLFPSATPATLKGESLVIGGNECEVFDGHIDIMMPSADGGAIVIQKIYKQ